MLVIVSYNVMMDNYYLPERYEALISLLLRHSIDVICLQEVRADYVDWFIKKLKKRYYPLSSVLLPKHREYGEMVFNQYCHILYDCIPLDSKMSRVLHHVNIGKYNIVTFHLESLSINAETRKRQLSTLWNLVSKLPNVICCGDTNQCNDEMVDLPRCFVDAWEQAAIKGMKPSKYTYYGGRYWNKPTDNQRYDKVWYSNDTDLVNYSTIGGKSIREGVWISDHDGIICEFL